jgi:uroporphyrin-III C-methyltransferase / precorrin-2 dehydrogenase / sirohydrochlorin ferrochelatase
VDYFPMFLDLRGKRCVLVGGGAVAARKAEALLRAGAQLHVVAPELGAGLRAQVEGSTVSQRVGAYAIDDLIGAQLVIAATDDPAVNASVSCDAHRLGVLVNVVDQPNLSSFIVPALVDRSPVVIAVSSAGAAPVLARTLRGKLESFVPAGYGLLASVCAALRADVKQALPEPSARRAFWEVALESHAAELALRGALALAEQEMRALLAAWAAASPSFSGEAVCIGVGPGDPDLISFRAQRAMLRAGAIFHAADVPSEIIQLCRRDAPRSVFTEPLPEGLIACLPELGAQLRRGLQVCVLVRGDGFRTPEGARALRVLEQAGLSTVVVPGIALG